MKKTTNRREYKYHLMPITRGDLIKKWIVESGLSIREIEKTYGIARNTLYRAIYGKRLQHTTIKKIANMIGVDWRILVEEW